MVERSSQAPVKKHSPSDAVPGPGAYEPRPIPKIHAQNIVGFRDTAMRGRSEGKKAPGPAYYSMDTKITKHGAERGKSFHLNLKGSWV